MELFLQTVLGSVELNSHVDKQGVHYEYFSGWFSRTKDQWDVLSNAEYHQRLNKSEEYLLTAEESNEGQIEIVVSQNSLPWIVMSSHVLLGFTTDVNVISKFMRYCGFAKVSNDVLQSIVEWSTYPSRLKLPSETQKFCETSFWSLQGAKDRGRLSEKNVWQQLTYSNITWQSIYLHHLSNSKLNAMIDTAGIVFYGLICQNENQYVLFFISCLTEAVEFSKPFLGENESLLARNISYALVNFLRKYGLPQYFVLVNPLSDWLYSTMEVALGQLTIASNSVFLAPFQISSVEGKRNKLVVKKLQPLISSLHHIFDPNNDDIRSAPPFSYMNSQASSWPSLFIENSFWTQNQASVAYPSFLDVAARMDPDKDSTTFRFAKELHVVDLPCLELMSSTEEGMYEMLESQPPNVDEEPSYRLEVSKKMVNEELMSYFASLLERSNGYNLVPGKEGQGLELGDDAKKMILHTWLCFKFRETGEPEISSDIPYHDMVHILSRGHDLFTILEKYDYLWQSRGTELTANKEDRSINVHCSYDGDIKSVSWWSDGLFVRDIFDNDSLVLPDSVEEAVEEFPIKRPKSDNGSNLTDRKSSSVDPKSFLQNLDSKMLDCIYNDEHPIVKTMLRFIPSTPHPETSTGKADHEPSPYDIRNLLKTFDEEAIDEKED